jgi:hypothetical protein
VILTQANCGERHGHDERSFVLEPARSREIFARLLSQAASVIRLGR